ncbi:DMT family transporter [Peribacillus glennii]|uniref:EamA family transporter n=1 Tax=Peribacillus glennii TaxID=2303991 RepID=A0A372LFH8_9BACI|nr:DMT family transporter [Peribacillus glennii]RFU65007.1 EamA family transporter [Peribacillus glennii]
MKRWTMELLLLIVVVIWGTNYTIGKYGVIEITPVEFTAIRMIIAAPFLLLIAMALERSIHIKRKDVFHLIIVSMVGVTLYQSFSMLTIKYISATNASLLISISPIFTMIFSLFFKQEKFSKQKLIGSVIAFTGTILILLVHDPSSNQKNVMIGTIIGILTSMSWGLYPILATPLVNKYSALRVIAWSTMIGAIPLVLLTGSSIVFIPFHLNQTSWLALLYAIFFVTIFGLVTWYVGVQKIGATNTMVYMFLTPFTAVLFAAIWAKEHIYIQQVVGGIIIFIGLWLVKHQRKTRVNEHDYDSNIL